MANRCSECGALVLGGCLECYLKRRKKEGRLSRVYNMELMSEGNLSSELSKEQLGRKRVVERRHL